MFYGAAFIPRTYCLTDTLTNTGDEKGNYSDNQAENNSSDVLCPFNANLSLIGPFLINIGVKYRILPALFTEVQAPLVLSELLKQGRIAISGGGAIIIYPKEAITYDEFDAGVTFSNGTLSWEHSQTVNLQPFLRAETGKRNGFSLSLKVGPVYIFTSHPYWSFNGELGFGWNL